MSSTHRKQQKGKLKKKGMSSKPEDIMDKFHNRNLAPTKWETLGDQVHKRGVKKVADELRGKNQSVGEWDERLDPPTGASDDSSIEDTGVGRSWRQTKSKDSQHFGDLFKHSIKEISGEKLSEGALPKIALHEYRRRLTHFKTRSDRPIETRSGLLERDLFRQKFGYASLDEGVDWNLSWRIELDENERIKLKICEIWKIFIKLLNWD